MCAPYPTPRFERSFSDSRLPDLKPETQKEPKRAMSSNCVNCGAPHAQEPVCSYCGTVIKDQP